MEIEGKLHKVYCKKCRHYVGTGSLKEGFIFHDCNHKKNIKLTDSWLKVDEKNIESPRDLNKNNDCPWHKKV